MVLTNIDNYIKKNHTICGYRLTENSYGTRTDVHDTILCLPFWRNSYSDSLIVKSFNDKLLVFQVRYNTNNDSGIEVDSLKKIRFW